MSSDESPAVVELPEPPVGSVVAAGGTVFLREEDDVHGAAWRKVGHLVTYGWADVLAAGDAQVIRSGSGELPDDAIEALVQAAEHAYEYTPYDEMAEHAWPNVVRAVYPLIAARVRAEAVAAERQRIKATVWTQRGLLADREHTLAVVNRIIDAAGSVPVATPQRPEIVVLCGSTRFKDAFREAARENALAGRIVLTVSDLDPRPEMRHVNVPIDADTKQRLDELHKRKIDMADRVLVLNVGGYVGESTRSEIEYATAHGKPISYLETGPRLQPGRVGFGTDAFEVGGSLPGQPVPTPTRARRYDQCDGTCTVDCGHCKGQGRPVATPERVTCRRCGYFVDSDAHERTCGRAATPTEPAAEQALAARAEQALVLRVLDAHDDELGTGHGLAYRAMVADHWRLIETFEPHRTAASPVPAGQPGHAIHVAPGHPTREGAGYDCCCGECLSLRRPGSAQQPDGWGEGVEAVDHPVNCGCASCVIDRLRESNDSLREQLSRAVDEIDGLRAEQPEER